MKTRCRHISTGSSTTKDEPLPTVAWGEACKARILQPGSDAPPPGQVDIWGRRCEGELVRFGGGSLLAVPVEQGSVHRGRNRLSTPESGLYSTRDPMRG